MSWRAPVVQVVMLSDTHVPGRAPTLAAGLWAAIDAADLVVHAGDWVGEGLLDEIAARSRRLLAVYGNNDGPGVRARLPGTATAVVGGLRVAVTHETGPSSGRDGRCARSFPDTDLLVFGHSHVPWDSTTATGLRLLNPGSPTDRRSQPCCTYLSAVIRAGRLDDVRLHAVDRVGARAGSATFAVPKHRRNAPDSASG